MFTLLEDLLMHDKQAKDETEKPFALWRYGYKQCLRGCKGFDRGVETIVSVSSCGRKT